MFHFYCFHNNKKIIVSDFSVQDIKKIYGYKYELVNSVRDKESIQIIKDKILKIYPNFIFVEHLKPTRKPLTLEQRKKISDSKIGLKRDAKTRAKISAKMKGKSNFEGKRHKEETKDVMAQKKVGNDHAKDLIWVYNPRGDEEKRVKTIRDIPVGFSQGRDYYSIENFLYSSKKNKFEY